MSEPNKKMTFSVNTVRSDAHGSVAHCKSEKRLELLHGNVKKYGTVFNTIAPGTQLSGVLRRKQE